MSLERQRQRLAKLVTLQHQLKALHETRHAGHLAAAGAAEEEARQIAGRFDDPASLATLFPEVYQNRIAAAFTRRDFHLERAAEEARNVVAVTLRTRRVEESYRDVARRVEEDAAAMERLENVERRIIAGK